MPIVFAHSARLHLRTATYFGVIDDNTLLRAYRTIARGGDTTFDNIVDLSGLTTALLTEPVFDQLTQLLPPTHASDSVARLAVVSPVGVEDHVTRLLACVHPGAQLHVCASLADAHRWLRGA